MTSLSRVELCWVALQQFWGYRPDLGHEYSDLFYVIAGLDVAALYLIAGLDVAALYVIAGLDVAALVCSRSRTSTGTRPNRRSRSTRARTTSPSRRTSPASISTSSGRRPRACCACCCATGASTARRCRASARRGWRCGCATHASPTCGAPPVEHLPPHSIPAGMCRAVCPLCCMDTDEEARGTAGSVCAL